MGRKFKKKKEPTDNLSQEFLARVDGAKTAEEIDEIISGISKAWQEMMVAKSMDEDLKQKQEAVRVAGEQYRDANRDFKLQLKYATDTLAMRGREIKGTVTVLTSIKGGQDKTTVTAELS